MLLAPPGSPYRGRANVELQELDGLDVIEPPDGVSCALTLERAWAAAGARRQAVFRTDDNLTVMRMVGAGIGHALVPELAAEPGLDADVEFVRSAGEYIDAPRRDLLAPRPLSLARRRDVRRDRARGRRSDHAAPVV